MAKGKKTAYSKARSKGAPPRVARKIQASKNAKGKK